jgi:hypothetical protein
VNCILLTPFELAFTLIKLSLTHIGLKFTPIKLPVTLIKLFRSSCSHRDRKKSRKNNNDPHGKRFESMIERVENEVLERKQCLMSKNNLYLYLLVKNLESLSGHVSALSNGYQVRPEHSSRCMHILSGVKPCSGPQGAGQIR